jgi:hypothetical protein
MDGSAGQVTCNTTYGQSRRWGVWNAYNRKKIVLQAGDSTASWTYSTNTARPSNNSSANSLTVFCGLAEENVEVRFFQSGVAGSTVLQSAIQAYWKIGIGVNSTTVMSGRTPIGGGRIDGSSIDMVVQDDLTANYNAAPFIGINTYTSLEQTTNFNNATMTYQGGSTGMLLEAIWEG